MVEENVGVTLRASFEKLEWERKRRGVSCLMKQTLLQKACNSFRVLNRTFADCGLVEWAELAFSVKQEAIREGGCPVIGVQLQSPSAIRISM